MQHFSREFMESEQLQSFNERLSQWISSQGFWFQLRFSMAGGNASSALYHLLRIGFRVFLFLLIVAIGGFYYLIKRVERPEFSRSLTGAIGKHLDAAECRIESFRRMQGEFNLRRIACAGSPDAFYSTLEAANITCRMGLLDGLTGVWKPGPILVKRLDMEIRTGSDDAESASRRAESFLKDFPKFDMSSLEVSDTSIRWGFSKVFDPRIRAGQVEPAKGEIKGSRMTVQRIEDGYRLQFRGGTFSQNWFEKLEIVELTAFINSKGIQIEKGEFIARTEGSNSSFGTVSFIGVTVGGGDRPAVSGTVRLSKVPLEILLPSRVEGFIEGSISCDLKMSGSTNSSDGIGFEGLVVMNGDDSITLRDRIHIFKALSVVDVFNNYKKLDFREGSFFLKTSAGSLSVTEVDLKSTDIITMKGAMKVRLPNDVEVQNAVTKRSTGELSPVFASDNTVDELSSSKDDQGENEITLKRAAEIDKVAVGSTSSGDSGLFKQLADGAISRQVIQQGMELFSKNLRYEGKFQLSIPGDSFERAPDLRQMHPADPTSGRISIDVPIEGNIYEITLSQAEDVYVKGRRKE